VITTIMFNYIAASLLVYLLVDVLRPQGEMDPATARFPATTILPTLNDIPGLNLIFTNNVLANVTLFIALAMAGAVWALLWRTRLGYQIRAFGKSESGGALCRDQPDPHHHGRHADLGRAGRDDGDQQRDGRGASGCWQLGLGRGLHRHRRGADGAQPPRSAWCWRRFCSASCSRAGPNWASGPRSRSRCGSWCRAW
jgi:hypothetical protein